MELRASIGVAWTDRPIDADTFVARADEAMYEAKQARRALATTSVTAPGDDHARCVSTLADAIPDGATR